MCDLILTGVGSRETTTEALELMAKIAEAFSNKGFMLRSGGAKGADSAFEDNWVGKKEIFLPWNGYENKWKSKEYIVPTITQQHTDLASKAHPNWSACREGARKMHTRNTCQVLGEKLDAPATLLVCWTVRGEYKGGTAVAMRVADMYGIPVYNLAIPNHVGKLREYYLTL